MRYVVEIIDLKVSLCLIGEAHALGEIQKHVCRLEVLHCHDWLEDVGGDVKRLRRHLLKLDLKGSWLGCLPNERVTLHDQS